MVCQLCISFPSNEITLSKSPKTLVRTGYFWYNEENEKSNFFASLASLGDFHFRECGAFCFGFGERIAIAEQ